MAEPEQKIQVGFDPEAMARLERAARSIHRDRMVMEVLANRIETLLKKKGA